MNYDAAGVIRDLEPIEHEKLIRATPCFLLMVGLARVHLLIVDLIVLPPLPSQALELGLHNKGVEV